MKKIIKRWARPQSDVGKREIRTSL